MGITGNSLAYAFYYPWYLCEETNRDVIKFMHLRVIIMICECCRRDWMNYNPLAPERNVECIRRRRCQHSELNCTIERSKLIARLHLAVWLIVIVAHIMRRRHSVRVYWPSLSIGRQLIQRNVVGETRLARAHPHLGTQVEQRSICCKLRHILCTKRNWPRILKFVLNRGHSLDN